MALEVHTPWPSSVWAMRIVTVSSGATTTQALISLTSGSVAQVAPSALMIWPAARCGIQKPTTSALGAAAARIGDLGIDLRISRISAFAQQRRNAHDHA